MCIVNVAKATIIGGVLAAALSTSALAGPTYVFSSSVGSQASNAGTITLTQIDADSVEVSLDLISPYGILNTGGPHTPFVFNLAGTGALSIAFDEPASGVYSNGTFTLNTSGGAATPYGNFSIAIDDSAGNGSGNAYYGDLIFTLTRAGGLSTDDFIANSLGYYFAADLTNGRTTGSQAWSVRVDPPAQTDVPEPLTLSLFGAGLAGAAALRRKRA